MNYKGTRYCKSCIKYLIKEDKKAEEQSDAAQEEFINDYTPCQKCIHLHWKIGCKLRNCPADKDDPACSHYEVKENE